MWCEIKMSHRKVRIIRRGNAETKSIHAASCRILFVRECVRVCLKCKPFQALRPQSLGTWDTGDYWHRWQNVKCNRWMRGHKSRNCLCWFYKSKLRFGIERISLICFLLHKDQHSCIEATMNKGSDFRQPTLSWNRTSLKRADGYNSEMTLIL